MKKKTASIAAAAITSLISLTAVVPAQAQYFGFEPRQHSNDRDRNDNDRYDRRDRVVRTYCDRHPRDRDCRGYYRGNWDRDDYRRFYGRNQSGLDNTASGLFGFTFGAIVGGALANGNNNNDNYYGGDRVIGRVDSNHVARCEARYRSYDARTDTFLSYDGNRYRCNL